MEQESETTGRRRPLCMRRADAGLRGSGSACGQAEKAFCKATLKVRNSGTDELRRLRVSWPGTASNSEVVDIISEAVESGFPDLKSPILSYFDNDGDRCAL